MPYKDLNYTFFNAEGIAVATTTNLFIDLKDFPEWNLLPLQYEEGFNGEILSVLATNFGPNRETLKAEIGN